MEESSESDRIVSIMAKTIETLTDVIITLQSKLTNETEKNKALITELDKYKEIVSIVKKEPTAE
jgi:hypothetical protein